MGRFIRWSFILLLIAAVLAVLLRGSLYRSFFHYRVLRDRAMPSLQRDMQLPAGTNAALDACIDAALDSTARLLHFHAGSAPSDPSVLIHGGGANCIGYAVLFSALCMERLAFAGLSDRYEVQPVVAELHFGEHNVHALFSSPFWKDHDIVRITDRRAGPVIYVDPTLYDATGISRVSGP